MENRKSVSHYHHSLVFLALPARLDCRATCKNAQKHNYRAEHWLVTEGSPKITINKNIFFKKKNDHVFIPLKAIHRIENIKKKQVKIVEAQIGSTLKETDIVRYQDIYGRI